MSDYGVVLFDSSSFALRAEAVLQRAGLQVKLVPTPRQLSSDCGLALRFDWEQKQNVEIWLGKCRVDVAGIHLLS